MLGFYRPARSVFVAVRASVGERAHPRRGKNTSQPNLAVRFRVELNRRDTARPPLLKAQHPRPLFACIDLGLRMPSVAWLRAGICFPMFRSRSRFPRR